MGKFKLITGLGNKDANKVKDLVLLWMEAGADIFDMSPSVLPVVQKEAIERGFKLSNYEFCVSVPIEGDVHGKKAKIDKTKCRACRKCIKSCLDGAISYANEVVVVDENKCIGCGSCKKACKYGAIEFYDDTNDDLESLLKTDAKIDTVEVHISIKDKKEIIKEFKKIVNLIYDRCSKISVCFNRQYFSNSKTIKILSKLKEIAGNIDFVVQTDGNSMNGAKNDIASTIETVAFGLFVKSLGYDVILSGGTNEYTAKLASDASLDCSIAYGSFARKLVMGLDKKEALDVAKSFILKTKELIND